MPRVTRVLVVEDEPLVRRLLVAMLAREGFEAEECGDGEDALPRIRSGRFALVLLDLVLPRVSGYELLGRLAATPSSPRPIIFVMTAYDPELRPPLDASLVAAVIPKPFDLDLLREMIRARVGPPPDGPHRASV